MSGEQEFYDYKYKQEYLSSPTLANYTRLKKLDTHDFYQCELRDINANSNYDTAIYNPAGTYQRPPSTPQRDFTKIDRDNKRIGGGGQGKDVRLNEKQATSIRSVPIRSVLIRGVKCIIAINK